MRLILFFAVLALQAQTMRVEPVSPAQGDALRVFASTPAHSVRIGGQSARFFPQKDGSLMALVAVPVLVKPGEHPLELLDSHGKVTDTQTIRIRDAHFRKQNVVLSKEVAALKPSPGEMEAVEALRNTVSDVRHWTEPFASPVPGCMTSPFGVLRLHNGKPTGNYHRGVDQRGAAGTPIRAIADGTVKIAAMYNVHGGLVGLDHGHGVTSAFLHMSGFAVREGATVKKGDVIGYVGSTGRSSAPHLHWGLTASGYPVNPERWVAMAPCEVPPAKKRQAPRR